MNCVFLEKHVKKSIIEKSLSPLLNGDYWPSQKNGVSFASSLKAPNCDLQKWMQKTIIKEVENSLFSMTSEKENLQMLKQYNLLADQVSLNSKEWENVDTHMENIYSCSQPCNNGELNRTEDVCPNIDFICNKSNNEEMEQSTSAILEHCIVDTVKPTNTENKQNKKYIFEKVPKDDSYLCTHDTGHEMCASLESGGEKSNVIWPPSCTVNHEQSHSKVSIIRLRPASQNEDQKVKNHNEDKFEKDNNDSAVHVTNKNALVHNKHKNDKTDDLSSPLYHSGSFCKNKTVSAYHKANNGQKGMGGVLTSKVISDKSNNRSFLQMKRSLFRNREVRSYFRHSHSQQGSKHMLSCHGKIEFNSLAKINSSVKGYSHSRYLLVSKNKEHKFQTRSHRNFKRRRRPQPWLRQKNATSTSKPDICINYNNLSSIKKEIDLSREDQIPDNKMSRTESIQSYIEDRMEEEEDTNIKTENSNTITASSANNEQPKDRDMPPLLLPPSPASVEEIIEETYHSPDSPEMPTLIPFTTENEDPPVFIKSEGSDDFESIPEEVSNELPELDNFSIQNDKLDYSFNYSPLNQYSFKESDKEDNTYSNKSLQQDSGYCSTPKFSPKIVKKSYPQTKRLKKSNRRTTIHYNKRKKRRKSLSLYKKCYIDLAKETAKLQPLVVLKRIPQSVIDWYTFSYDSESCHASTAESKPSTPRSRLSHTDDVCTTTADSATEMELHLDVIDGEEFYSFLSEKDMEKFSVYHGHNLSYNNELSDYEDNPDDTVFQEHKQKGIIIPRKTKDITQIKGWRNKLFIQDSYLSSLKQEDHINLSSISSSFNNTSDLVNKKQTILLPEDSNELKKESGKNSFFSVSNFRDLLRTSDIFSGVQKQTSIQKPKTIEEEVKSEKLKMMEDRAKDKNTRSAFMSDILDDFLKTRSDLRVGLLEKYNPNIALLPLDASILSIGLLQKPEKRHYILPSIPQNDLENSKCPQSSESCESDTNDLDEMKELDSNDVITDFIQNTSDTPHNNCSTEKISKCSYAMKRKIHHFSGAYSKKLKKYCLNSVEHNAQRLVLKLKKEVKNGESNEYKVTTLFSSVKSSLGDQKDRSSAKTKTVTKVNKELHSKCSSDKSNELQYSEINNDENLMKNHYSGGIADSCSLPIIKETCWSKVELDKKRLAEFISEWQKNVNEKSWFWRSTSRKNFTCPILSEIFAKRSLSTLLRTANPEDISKSKDISNSNDYLLNSTCTSGSKASLNSGQVHQNLIYPRTVKNLKFIKGKMKNYLQHGIETTPALNLKGRKKRSIRLPARYLDSAVLVAGGGEWVSPSVPPGHSDLKMKQNLKLMSSPLSQPSESPPPLIMPSDNSNDENDSHDFIDNDTCARTLEYSLTSKDENKEKMCSKQNSKKCYGLQNTLKHLQTVNDEASQSTSSISLRISNVTSLSSDFSAALLDSSQNVRNTASSGHTVGGLPCDVYDSSLSLDGKEIKTLNNDVEKFSEASIDMDSTQKFGHIRNSDEDRLKDSTSENSIPKSEGDISKPLNDIRSSDIRKLLLHLPQNTGTSQKPVTVNVIVGNKVVPMMFVTPSKVVQPVDKLKTISPKPLLVNATHPQNIMTNQISLSPPSSLSIPVSTSTGNQVILVPAATHAVNNNSSGNLTEQVSLNSLGGYMKGSVLASNQNVLSNVYQNVPINTSDMPYKKFDTVSVNNNLTASSKVQSHISQKIGKKIMPQIESVYSACKSFALKEKNASQVEALQSTAVIVPDIFESTSTNSLKVVDKSLKLPMVVTQVSLPPVQQKSTLSNTTASLGPVNLPSQSPNTNSANSKIIKPIASPGSRLLVAKSLFPAPVVNKGQLNILSNLSPSNVTSGNVEPVKTNDLASVNSGVTCFKPSVTFVKLGDKYGNKFLPVMKKLGAAVPTSKSASQVSSNVGNDKQGSSNVANDKKRKSDSSLCLRISQKDSNEAYDPNQGKTDSASKSDIVGKRHPTIISLLNPSSSASGSSHDMSHVAKRPVSTAENLKIKYTVVNSHDSTFSNSHDTKHSDENEQYNKPHADLNVDKNFNVVNLAGKIKTEDCRKGTDSLSSVPMKELSVRIKKEDFLPPANFTSVSSCTKDSICSSNNENSTESLLQLPEVYPVSCRKINQNSNFFSDSFQEDKHSKNSQGPSSADHNFINESHLEMDFDNETLEKNFNSLKELNSKIRRCSQANNTKVNKIQQSNPTIVTKFTSDSNQYDHNYPLMQCIKEEKDLENSTSPESFSGQTDEKSENKEDSNFSLEESEEETDESSDSSEDKVNIKVERERSRRKRHSLLFNALKLQSEAFQEKNSKREMLNAAQDEIKKLGETSLNLEATMQSLLAQRKALIMKYKELWQKLSSEEQKKSLSSLVSRVQKESIYSLPLGLKFDLKGGDGQKNKQPSSTHLLYRRNALQVLNERIRLGNSLGENDSVQESTINKQSLIDDLDCQTKKDFVFIKAQQGENIPLFFNQGRWNFLSCNEGVTKTTDHTFQSGDSDNKSPLLGNSSSRQDNDLTKVATAACKLFGPCVVRRVKLRNGQTVYGFTPYKAKDKALYLPSTTDTSKSIQQRNLSLASNETELSCIKNAANMSDNAPVLLSMLCSNDTSIESSQTLKNLSGDVVIPNELITSQRSNISGSRTDYSSSGQSEKDASSSSCVSKDNDCKESSEVEDNTTSVWISGTGEPCYVTRIMSDEEDELDCGTDIPETVEKKDEQEELPTIVSFSTISEEEFLKPLEEKNAKSDACKSRKNKDCFISPLSDKTENCTIANRSTLNKDDLLRSVDCANSANTTRCSSEQSNQETVSSKINGSSTSDEFTKPAVAAGFSVLTEAYKTLENKKRFCC